jgi:methionyl-tRNA formyltransferase
LKVLETGFDPEAHAAPPGEVAALDGLRGLAVGTGRGTLFLRQIQPEGSRPMSAAEWLRGHPLSAGDRFE